MKKILKWIKKNLGLFIVFILALILLIFICIIFIGLLKGNSLGNYGSRLDGIENVKISNEIYEGVEKEVMETELVEEISTRLQGKIVYTTIVLKSDVDSGKAKELAEKTLDNYEEDQLGFYDFSFFLKWKGDDSDTVIAGNKHHSLDSITWTNS